MSSGVFARSFYEDDTGETWLARVQPETIAGFNPAPPGPATVPVRANMSGGRRRNGVVARSITVNFGSSPPTGYKPDSPIRIPILTPDAYDAIVKGSTVTYLGSAATVVGKSPERLN